MSFESSRSSTWYNPLVRSRVNMNLTVPKLLRASSTLGMGDWTNYKTFTLLRFFLTSIALAFQGEYNGLIIPWSLHFSTSSICTSLSIALHLSTGVAMGRGVLPSLNRILCATPFNFPTSFRNSFLCLLNIFPTENVLLV